MSADDQAAISEASSLRGRWLGGASASSSGQSPPVEGPDRMWKQILDKNAAFECEKSNAGGGPGRTTQLLPARGAAGPGVLLLGAGRCVHRLLNGSINA